MRTIIKLCFSMLLLVTLTACGVTKVSIKPEVKQKIRTIAIVLPEEPPVRVKNLGGLGNAFGAIGTGIQAAVEGDFLKLDKTMRQKKFTYSRGMVTALRKELRKAGYKTKIVKIKRKEPGKLREDYSRLRVKGADALLDVVITNIGYVTENFVLSPEWRPESRAMFALSIPRQKETVYQETIMYGYHNPFMTGTEIDAPKKFQFNGEAEITKASKKTIISGLQDSINKIAAHVAEQLKK